MLYTQNTAPLALPGAGDFAPPDLDDAPEIPYEQALRDVFAAMTGDANDAAYGMTRDEWLGWARDYLAEQQLDSLAAGLLTDTCPSVFLRSKRAYCAAVHHKVNELVAEMDPDELELLL